MKSATTFKRLSLGLVGALTFGVSALSNAAAVVTASYNLGSSSGPGATNVPTTACGFSNSAGADALEFTSSGNNSIGIHTYSCNFSAANATSFGSRSSGENTFYADGLVTVNETFTGDSFTFNVDAGAVGAFGSSLFGADEYQSAKLRVFMSVDGNTILDEMFSAFVGQNGIVSMNRIIGAGASLAIDAAEETGAGYGAFNIFGLFETLALSAGVHTVSYTIGSVASGNVDTAGPAASDCGAPGSYTRGGGGEEAAARFAVADLAEGLTNVYCGAGSRSGDPFGPGIARVFNGLLVDNPVPVPAPLALLGAGFFALGFRRRAA